MAVLNVSQVNFGGIGSKGNFHHKENDTQEVLSQPNAKGVQAVNVIILVDISIAGKAEPVPANTEATCLIGVDGSGNQLRDSNHKLALPCPPYCGKGD